VSDIVLVPLISELLKGVLSQVDPCFLIHPLHRVTIQLPVTVKRNGRDTARFDNAVKDLAHRRRVVK
jgi:hypothetical protein